MKLLALCLLVMQLVGNCAPQYERPNTEIPPAYRDEGAATNVPSMGDLGWWQIYDDPNLRQLIRIAIAQNTDVAIAEQRIQQAQAELTIVGSQRYPNINAVLSAPYTKYNSATLPAFTSRETFTPVGLMTLSYEFDLFGKIANETKAAQAATLATEYAKQTVMTTLVGSVASLYFQILELDDELVITRETLTARKQSLDLQLARLEAGIGTEQEVLQATQLVAEAQGAIPELESASTQAENALSILLGGYPNAIPRGFPLNRQIAMPAVPDAGLPASLLEHRPDIRSAEEQLIASNAQIGVARALLFPQISITGSAGAGSEQANGFWLPVNLVSITPQLIQQIFNAGAARANVSQSEAAKEAAVLQYVESVHNGYGDVSNALVAYKDDRKYAIDQAVNAAAAVQSLDLANARFDAGITSFLEVLDSETRSYSAQISASQAELKTRLDLVQLYKALGGGWQPEPVSATAHQTR
ncbi:MAG: efflux transporter outer membrane subunit [Candidatus Eremiobacteraeota bacterium]|nr:efflux transporter outer membrane subunit [Candidatus Eremiobacteraeota bacterium]